MREKGGEESEYCRSNISVLQERQLQEDSGLVDRIIDVMAKCTSEDSR